MSSCEVQFFVNNVEVESSITVFSDGATTLTIDKSKLPSKPRYFSFTIFPKVPVDTYLSLVWQFSILMADYIEKTPTRILTVPYFPYARADRSFDGNNMVAVGVEFSKFARQFFTEIHCEDLHSDLIPNAISIPQSRCLEHAISWSSDKSLEDFTLCFPDAGAVKKSTQFNNHLDFITCSKVRNKVNGYLSSFKIESGDPSGKDILIVDDICDGGMTFTLCAKSLLDKGAKSVSLYVTHGIFSKGLKPFDGLFKEIFVNNIIGNYVDSNDLIHFNKGR